MWPGLEASTSVSPELVWSTHWFISPFFLQCRISLPTLSGRQNSWMTVRNCSASERAISQGLGGIIVLENPKLYAAKEADEALLSFLLQNQFETLETLHKHREGGMSTQGIEDSNIDQFIILVRVLTLFFTFQSIVHIYWIKCLREIRIRLSSKDFLEVLQSDASQWLCKSCQWSFYIGRK